MGRSFFSQGHRVIGNLSYEIKWNNNLRTQLGLFYTGSEGAPFSYTYRDGADLLNDDSNKIKLAQFGSISLHAFLLQLYKG